MLRELSLALAATVALGAAPAFAADQVQIPANGSTFDVGVATLEAAPRVTEQERARLEEIRTAYQTRVDAAKAKLTTLVKQYRDMQAHYAPVPQQAKVHDQIIALNDELAAANKDAWAQAAALLKGKVVLVNQGGGGGTVVVPGRTQVIQPGKMIDPNAHPEQVPPEQPKQDENQPHHPMTQPQ